MKKPGQSNRRAMFAPLLLGFVALAHAGTGNLFRVTSSGPLETLRFQVCLNAQTPWSCETHTVTHQNIDIQTVTPNHTYPAAGILVLTPGHTMTGCTLLGNGYCQFSVSDTKSAHIEMPSTSTATITVNPSTLLFAENATGDVTVTNNAASPVAADNVTETIPAGSHISVQSTTCGAVLAIGTSCTITFASGTQEGPTIIPIKGSNTNTVNVGVTVTDQPQISITNPIQQDRVVAVSGAALSLEITNAADSLVNANAITVTNKATCPNLAVDDSNCASVAPGATCTLGLTSNSPYAPCTIIVSGSNTANSTMTLIAFSHQGGLVFQESLGSGKVVIDVAQGFKNQWTSTLSNIAGATDLDDGFANTNAIVGAQACSDDTSNCAAQRCRNISADWYLPARNELSTVYSALCSNSAIPCNFGSFAADNYWSSSQFVTPTNSARYVRFPSGSAAFGEAKNTEQSVRCIRAFTP